MLQPARWTRQSGFEGVRSRFGSLAWSCSRGVSPLEGKGPSFWTYMGNRPIRAKTRGSSWLRALLLFCNYLAGDLVVGSLRNDPLRLKFGLHLMGPTRNGLAAYASPMPGSVLSCSFVALLRSMRSSALADFFSLWFPLGGAAGLAL
jgi:hypothetical protein